MMKMSLRVLCFALISSSAFGLENTCGSDGCVEEDDDDHALLQLKLQKHSEGNKEEMSQLNLVDALAKLAKSNAIAKDLEGTVLTETITSDPDEDDDGHMPTPDSPASPPDAPGNTPSNLLSTNATRKATGKSCPAQPSGWHGCAWGKVFGEPAFCASSNRITLNGGVPVNFEACAFLTANVPSCSNYFYTTSTASNAGGVCKCCKQGPTESTYYVSNSCNYVYYASTSCNIR